MTESYPDIEIYLKRPEEGAVRAWLDQRFGVARETNRGDSVVYQLGQNDLECVVVDRAVKGGYTSVWFRSGRMPWQDDLTCAREAFEQFGVEIRCSAAPWADQDGDDETGGWIRLTDKGESRVNWRA